MIYKTIPEEIDVPVSIQDETKFAQYTKKERVIKDLVTDAARVRQVLFEDDE
jgi:hypothetical protein